MANAIRKRIALAAVAALGAGVLTAAPASANQTISFTQSAIRAGENSSISVALGTAADDSYVKVRFDSAPTGGYTFGASASTGTSGFVATSAQLSGGAKTATVAFTRVGGDSDTAIDAAGEIVLTTAGVYNVTLWVGDNDSVLEPGETYAAGSITVGGTPSAIALSAASSTVVVGTSVSIFTTSLTDAAGRGTRLASGETLNIVSSTSGTGTLALSSSPTQVGAYSVNPTEAGNAGTYTVTVSPGGTLSGAIAAQTHTLTVVAAGTTAPTDITTTLATNITKGGSAGARTATVNATVKTFDVSVSGASASKPVVLYANVAGGTAPTGLTIAGVSVTPGAAATGTAVYAGTADADGKLTFTVATTDTSLNTDKLGFSTLANAGAEGAKTLVFTWATAVPAASASSTNMVLAVGTAASVTVTVADQFTNPGAGYFVSAQTDVTTAGTGGPAVGTKGALVTGVTAADGTITLSAPAPAGAVNGTIVNVIYTVKTSTNADLATPKVGATAYAVNFTTDGAITSLTLSGLAATTSSTDLGAGVTTPADGVATAGADAVTFTVTPSTSTIVAITGSSADVWFATADAKAWNAGKNSLSEGASSSGTAFYAWSTKVGTHSVTVTAGGKTVTRYFKVTAGAARNVAVSAPAELGNGKVAVATVTVTDPFGNAVSSATINLSITGSAFFNGTATTASLTSGTDGTATVSIVGAAAGSGDLVVKATGSGAQFGALAGTTDPAATTAGTNGFTASTSPASVSMKLIAEKSAAELAAEKAQAEAAKATAEAAKALAAVTAVQTSITAIQTAISTLVASFTSTLLILQNNLQKVMKKLGIK